MKNQWGTEDLSRFTGCLLGGAVGDALGAPVEFLSMAEIRALTGERGVTGYLPAYGRIGAITDDTQMTMFTSEGLLRARVRGVTKGLCHPPSMVHAAYLRWLATQGETSRMENFGSVTRMEGNGWLIGVRELWERRAPGNSCLSALRSARMGLMVEPINDSKGCGGVMRMAPVGLVAESIEEAYRLGCECAAITHGHPTGYTAAGAFAVIIHCVCKGRSIGRGVEAALAELGRDRRGKETADALHHAVVNAEHGDGTPEHVAKLGKGWVADEALAIGVYCALRAEEDLGRGVLMAVNHSGDSDSTGAIAGNLLGALLGIGAVPPAWLRHLECREAIERLATDLHRCVEDTPAWWQAYPGA